MFSRTWLAVLAGSVVLWGMNQLGGGSSFPDPVTVGELTPDGLEILEGIGDGVRIVTAGVRRLQDGRKVRVLLAPSGSP